MMRSKSATNRRLLRLWAVAIFLALSTLSLPVLLDGQAATTFVTPVLAEDFDDGGD